MKNKIKLTNSSKSMMIWKMNIRESKINLKSNLSDDNIIDKLKGIV